MLFWAETTLLSVGSNKEVLVGGHCLAECQRWAHAMAALVGTQKIRKSAGRQWELLSVAGAEVHASGREEHTLQ